jgi:DNA-binding CsgD family transcriptional regulator
MHTTITLSLREKEVLHCLSQGMTTDQTAEELYITHETVKTHRSRLKQKFNARNAFHLGVLVMRRGVLEMAAESA